MARLTRWHPRWNWDMTPLFRLTAPSQTAFSAYLPPMDIEEKDEQYVITLSVPGFSQDNLHIAVEDDVLHIEGSLTQDSQSEEDAKGRKYHLRERHMARFARSVRLPGGIDEDQIKAQYKTGVLTLVIPKPTESMSKQIEITAG